MCRRALFVCTVQEVKLHEGGHIGEAGARMYDGCVTELKLSLPRWKHAGDYRLFDYTPGQYASIRVGELSRIEWHPFTISSAPCDDFIMFHISAKGVWRSSLGLPEQGSDIGVLLRLFRRMSNLPIK